MPLIKTNSILVVDDNTNNIRVLFEILHNSGFQVSVVKSGEMALEKVPSIQPDLILLDVMMPGIDGFETCHRLKSNESTKEIPIIFMTALSEVENKVKGLHLGAVDYITKPIQVEEVLARVNVHLSLRNTKIELLDEISERRQAEIKLQQTLKDLQAAQIQLIQSEKMSGLGQMVAGVAHEINNPVNFIYGNIDYLDEYTKNLLRMLNLYQQIYSMNQPEVQALAEEIDLEFLVKDLQKLLPSMKMGAERIRNIVLSLRNFSRMDEAEFKAVDIHEGIESTLMILQYRLKDRPERPAIEVIRDYGKLPLVECYAGQLNQVLMNILANAIDALEETCSHYTYQEMKQNPHKIMIRTFLSDSQWVTIAIADNGLGIPDKVKNRIFDPFFTTKPVGKGTGLGLAISYQIITQKHGGKLDCLSTPGQGTEFIIKIPVQQRN
ncbi:response regulator receiver sensor signal transduction histidine kinase [Calothrix sp. NIES-2100]|uniref:hybrid sensor histidine kinase/response regulator n=1 Tax=Calothrix sp. NIES-2100 TaxID=1954172 RepID=UPI000B5F190D|nr:response regulator receiver sensor signal transduction histidine kinase [Calothrix sp. NIES-2100]